MMRIIAAGLVVAVFAVFQMLAVAGTPVLTEDFEGATVGADPITAGPLTWQARVAVSDRTTEGTYGVDGKLVIAESGGNKYVELQDLNSTLYSMDSLVTSQALMDHNAGNGIRKGTVQLDWTLVSGSGYMQVDVYDDADITKGFSVPQLTGGTDAQIEAMNNLLCHIRLNTLTLQIRTTNSAGARVHTNVPTNITVGNTYRFFITFDVDTRAIEVDIDEKAPAGSFTDFFLLSTALADARIYSNVDAVSPFKGVRGIGFYQGVAALETIGIDNLVFTDTDTPMPEVAVSVDSVEVANGGTIDFGGPAVDEVTSKIVTVSNTGAAALNTSALAVAGDRFTLKAGEVLEPVIAAGGSDTIEIEMSTAAPTGIYTGTLAFTTDDADETSVSINLTGDVGNTEVEDWQDR